MKIVRAFEVDGKLYATQEEASKAEDEAVIAEGFKLLSDGSESMEAGIFIDMIKSNKKVREALARLMLRIAERDEEETPLETKAREMYDKSTSDLRNDQYVSWKELSDRARMDWVRKAKKLKT